MSNPAIPSSFEPTVTSRRIFHLLSDRSLRVKLILAFLAVTALSVGAVAYFTSRATQAELTKGVGDSLHNLARIKAQAIGELLARQIDTLQAFGLSKVVQDKVE